MGVWGQRPPLMFSLSPLPSTVVVSGCKWDGLELGYQVCGVESGEEDEGHSPPRSANTFVNHDEHSVCAMMHECVPGVRINSVDVLIFLHPCGGVVFWRTCRWLEESCDGSAVPSPSSCSLVTLSSLFLYLFVLVFGMQMMFVFCSLVTPSSHDFL